MSPPTAQDHQCTVRLSRTLAPGTKSVNMVDWKYSVFSLVNLDHRAHLPAIKFLESGPGLRSNRTIWRLDLFHHAPSEARRSLPSVPLLLGGPPELVPGTTSLCGPPLAALRAAGGR